MWHIQESCLREEEGMLRYKNVGLKDSLESGLWAALHISQRI